MNALYRIPYTLGEAGEITFAPNPVEFGEVAISQIQTQDVLVRNETKSIQSQFTFSVNAPFSVLGHSCSDLDPGQSCGVRVSYLPHTAQTHTQLLELTTTEGRTASVPLIGKSVKWLSELEISDDGWNFGYWKPVKSKSFI